MKTPYIFATANQKGGVGKTTLAVGLAWELAREFRVLLVDIDPQFNATQWVVDANSYLTWDSSVELGPRSGWDENWLTSQRMMCWTC